MVGIKELRKEIRRNSINTFIYALEEILEQKEKYNDDNYIYNEICKLEAVIDEVENGIENLINCIYEINQYERRS